MQKAAVCVWILLVVIAVAVQPVAAQVSSNDTIDRFEQSLNALTESKDSVMRMRSNAKSDFADEGYDTLKFEKALEMYNFKAKHLQRSFTWQFYSSIFIFVMVMVIVGMGLVLSFKQFKLTELQVKRNTGNNPDNKVALESNNATIEISQTGLKINTAVIGLAILFLSLLFFFLYLKYVYVIEVVNGV